MLSNYATEADIKNISHVDTSSFALKKNLANLKTEVDKLDIDKLVPLPVDLSKSSDVVKNYVVKKDVYHKLVTKVNSNDTNGFVIKTKYDTDKSELENKTPDMPDIVKKVKLTELENKNPDVPDIVKKVKLTELENKNPDVSNLATKTAVENKITNVSNLVKKQTMTLKLQKLKINLIIITLITTPELNSLATNVFNARIAQANLITKTDFDAKLSSLNRKITQNKTKH